MNKPLIMLEVDPQNHYIEIDKDSEEGKIEQLKLVDVAGILTQWAFDSLLTANPLEAMSARYMFPMHEAKGGKIDGATGVFSYPEDPDQYPLLSLTNLINGKRIFIYRFSVVAIETKRNEFFRTRMD